MDSQESIEQKAIEAKEEAGNSKPKSSMLEEFRRPFMSTVTSFKVQAGKESSKSVLCVAYVDARDVQERLNFVCDEFDAKWSNKNREIFEDGKIVAVEAAITIDTSDPNAQYRDTIKHTDVGSRDNVNEKTHGLKALYSDAFKRAAVHFGIAVSLYGLPQMWLPNNPQNLKWNNGQARMQKQGDAVLREQLVTYLKNPKTMQSYGIPREF